MISNKPDSQNICNAGEYYIASVLSANGFTTTLTLGRAEKYDILAINPKGKTIKVQVKTLFGKGQWRMNAKNERIKEKDTFYAFVRLNDMEKDIEYWIVPSQIVANFVKTHYEKWLEFPRRDGTKHKEGDWRAFRVTTDKFSLPNWTEKCKKYYKNVDLLLE